MFPLLRNITSREVFLTEAPSFFLSLLIAELFYKWRSFVLEGMGFLVTWYCVSAIVHTIRNGCVGTFQGSQET